MAFASFGDLSEKQTLIIKRKKEKMAYSQNRVTLIGNVGKEPEVFKKLDGPTTVSLSVATSDKWMDKETGEYKEKTEWHRVVIFNEKLAELAEKYVKKGSRVYIEGKVQTRKYTDKSGVEKYTTEIVVPQFKGELGLLDSNTIQSASESVLGGDWMPF